MILISTWWVNEYCKFGVDTEGRCTSGKALNESFISIGANCTHLVGMLEDPVVESITLQPLDLLCYIPYEPLAAPNEWARCLLATAKLATG